jgi:hypothetical protein
MSKFKLTEDIVILDKRILDKDSEISFNESGELIVESEYGPIKLTKDILKGKIKSLEENISVKISVLDDDDEEQVKNYRLQLDFKASRKKVIEIETYLRKTLFEML